MSNSEPLSRTITATRTLRARRNGDIAFFDGEVGGRSIRIQTRAGDPLCCRVDGTALVPVTEEADALLTELLQAAVARDEARAALLERKRSEAPARLEAIMAELTKDSSAEFLAANAPLVRAWRAAAAEHVAHHMGYASEWEPVTQSVAAIGQTMVFHPDREVRRLVRGGR